MGTKTIKFKFARRHDLDEISRKVKVMEQKAVNWLIANNKTALSSVHAALYYPLRDQFPELHSQWVVSALKTSTGIVHKFNKRKRKGKAKRPQLKNPFVSLNHHLFKVSWNGKLLTISISKSADDPKPILLCFKPHHKYKELLNDWKEGRCEIGQITLTPTTVSIPLKFPDKLTYVPATVIGVDSNENSLDYFVAFKGELKSLDTAKISFINRDHDRRVMKGTKGKRNPKARLKIQRKHGRLRSEKTRSLWNAFALLLINLAIQNQAALVLENLKGLKPKISLEQASRRMRQRLLNYWSIMSFHRILDVKCREYGVPIVFVDPNGTSKSCPKCGGSLRGQDKRCPTCGLSRHYVAAINIACRGIERFPSLSGLGQGFVGDPCSLSSGGKVSGMRCATTTGSCAVEKSTA